METTAPLSQDVWERTPAAAQPSIRALEARVVALATTVQRLLERLRMDAPNTSQPPSSAPPVTHRPPWRRTPSGRQPGGQPGHPGQTRWATGGGEAVSLGQPQACPAHAGRRGRPHGLRGPIGLLCPACGATTRATVPIGVPAGPCGATRARDRRPVDGSRSPVATHHAGCQGRPGGDRAASGPQGQPGARHGAGLGGSSGRHPAARPYHAGLQR